MDFQSLAYALVSFHRVRIKSLTYLIGITVNFHDRIIWMRFDEGHEILVALPNACIFA